MRVDERSQGRVLVGNIAVAVAVAVVVVVVVVYDAVVGNALVIAVERGRK